MGFSDTLRELLDQGLAVSKDLAAKAGEKAQDWGSKGLSASLDFAARAGAKVQEMSEKGALALEIKHLENQAKKLLGLLGAEVYSLYEQGTPWTSDEPGIMKILGEIASVKESIEEREENLEKTGKKPETT